MKVNFFRCSKSKDYLLVTSAETSLEELPEEVRNKLLKFWELEKINTSFLDPSHAQQFLV